MKAESKTRPEALSVEECAGGISEIVFCENISEEERNGELVYKYEEHRTAVPTRPNLLAAVKKSKAAWLARAIVETADAEMPKASLGEQILSLQHENMKLKEENEVIGAALEEVISLMLGGDLND